MSKELWPILSLSAVLTVGIVIAGQVFAQEVEALEEPVDLGTLVLTPERRPIAPLDSTVGLTVVDPDEALSAGTARDPIGELARRTPNLNFVNGGTTGQSFISIRGIGPFGEPINSQDTALGFFIDGVPTTLLGYQAQFLDVDRIEVVKGPQGALYGRSTLGGAVNIIPTLPGIGEPNRLRFELGSDGYALGELVAETLSSDGRFGGRFALRASAFDGDIGAPFISGDVNATEILSFRGSVTADITENFSAEFSTFYNDDRRNNPLFVLRDGPNFPSSGTDIEPRSDTTNAFGTLRLTYSADLFDVVSTTNFQRNEAILRADSTDALLFGFNAGVPSLLFNDPNIDFSNRSLDEDVFFQELRVVSREGSPIDWSFGVSYLEVETDGDLELNSRRPNPAAPGTFIDTSTRTLSISSSTTTSIFGDLSFPVTDRLRASASARVAFEDQEFSGSSTTITSAAPFPIVTNDDAETSDTDWSGRLGLLYDLTDDSRLYFNVARGYSSEGFQSATSPVTVFPAGSNLSFEAGYRAKLLDERLFIDVTGFYNDVENAPFTELVDFTNFIFDVRTQDYTTYGLELQANYQLSDTW